MNEASFILTVQRHLFRRRRRQARRQIVLRSFSFTRGFITQLFQRHQELPAGKNQQGELHLFIVVTVQSLTRRANSCIDLHDQ